HESADYQWYQILRNTLLNMNTETDEAKKEMIDYCRKYYQKEEVVLGAIDEFERSYTSSCQSISYKRCLSELLTGRGETNCFDWTRQDEG
ncbi:unnamed protein product, partial [Didymodactylos carnosus]